MIKPPDLLETSVFAQFRPHGAFGLLTSPLVCRFAQARDTMMMGEEPGEAKRRGAGGMDSEQPCERFMVHVRDGCSGRAAGAASSNDPWNLKHHMFFSTNISGFINVPC